MQAANRDQFQITTFSEESRLAYDRVQLSSFFSGASAEDLALTNPEFYRDNNVEFSLNNKIIAIDTATQSISTAAGTTVQYDKYSVVPRVPALGEVAKEFNLYTYAGMRRSTK